MVTEETYNRYAPRVTLGCSALSRVDHMFLAPGVLYSFELWCRYIDVDALRTLVSVAFLRRIQRVLAFVISEASYLILVLPLCE